MSLLLPWQTSGAASTSANAEAATGTGTAYGATISLAPTANVAAGTGAALTVASISLAPTAEVAAGCRTQGFDGCVHYSALAAGQSERLYGNEHERDNRHHPTNRHKCSRRFIRRLRPGCFCLSVAIYRDSSRTNYDPDACRWL